MNKLFMFENLAYDTQLFFDLVFLAWYQSSKGRSLYSNNSYYKHTQFTLLSPVYNWTGLVGKKHILLFCKWAHKTCKNGIFLIFGVSGCHGLHSRSCQFINEFINTDCRMLYSTSNNIFLKIFRYRVCILKYIEVICFITLRLLWPNPSAVCIVLSDLDEQWGYTVWKEHKKGHDELDSCKYTTEKLMLLLFPNQSFANFFNLLPLKTTHYSAEGQKYW